MQNELKEVLKETAAKKPRSLAILLLLTVSLLINAYQIIFANTYEDLKKLEAKVEVNSAAVYDIKWIAKALEKNEQDHRDINRKLDSLILREQGADRATD